MCEAAPITDSAEPKVGQATPPSWWAIAALMVVTLLVRGGVLWAQYDNLREDPDGYTEIADVLRTYGVYGYRRAWTLAVPSAYRPPLYPIVLSKVYANLDDQRLGVALLHLGLGLATVLLTWWVGRQWELGSWAYAAALLVAVDPILLQQSTLVMTETLATFIAVVGLACLTRYVQSPSFYWAGLCGGALALAMLCRPTFAVWLALAALPVMLTPETWGRRVLSAVAFVLVAVVVIGPWVVRNAIVMGRPIASTTHGGYTFWLANNRHFFVPGEYQLYYIEAQCIGRGQPHPPFDSPQDELAAEQEIMDEALEDIQEDRLGFALACGYRLTRLWGVLPLDTVREESTARRLARYAVALWYSAVMLVAALGVWSLGWKLWQSPWLWGVLLCIAFTLVHAVYWTDLRMRAPLTPMIALTAAFALLTIARRWWPE